jgi:hypothetical protein
MTYWIHNIKQTYKDDRLSYILDNFDWKNDQIYTGHYKIAAKLSELTDEECIKLINILCKVSAKYIKYPDIYTHYVYSKNIYDDTKKLSILIIVKGAIPHDFKDTPNFLLFNLSKIDQTNIDPLPSVIGYYINLIGNDDKIIYGRCG